VHLATHFLDSIPNSITVHVPSMKLETRRVAEDHSSGIPSESRNTGIEEREKLRIVILQRYFFFPIFVS
jgi:hypothetical protein